MAGVTDAAPVDRAPVALLRTKGDYQALRPSRNLLHRTAGYVTRPSGGVGGGGREAFPYPDSTPRQDVQRSVRYVFP